MEYEGLEQSVDGIGLQSVVVVGWMTAVHESITPVIVTVGRDNMPRPRAVAKGGDQRG